MLVSLAITVLWSQEAKGVPVAQVGPAVRYVAKVRRPTERDYGSRMYRDKRVTYLKDYRVLVRLPGRTVTLRRPATGGLVDVQAIGSDGSILYEVHDWHTIRSYSWVEGKVTRISMPGFDTTRVVGYKDRRNYYCESMRSMGARGYPLSGYDLFQISDGVARYLGPGELVSELRPEVPVASADVRKDGTAAGIDDDRVSELRIYDEDGYAKLRQGRYLGRLAQGTLVASGPCVGEATRNEEEPGLRTIYHFREGRFVPQIAVPGIPRLINRRGLVLLLENNSESTKFRLFDGKVVRAVAHDLPATVRRQAQSGVGAVAVHLNDDGVISFWGQDREYNNLIITLTPKK